MARGNHVDTEKTGMAVHGALEEVQHAARRDGHSLRETVSWAVALAAGGTVAWRSLRALRSDQPAGAGSLKPPAQPRAGDSALPRDASGAGFRSSRRDESSGGGDNRSESEVSCAAKPMGAGALAKELLCRFQTAECMTRSQALAFIGVLSLGPVLLFALAALGFVIKDVSQVQRFVHDLVGQLLPGREASDAANSLIAQTHILESAQTLMKGKWWAVTIGIVSLLWAAIGLFVGASDPINVSWNVKETRSFIKLRAVCLGVFVGSGVLFLLSLVPSSLPVLVGKMPLAFLGDLAKSRWWIDLVSWLLAIVVNGAMFTVIYRFLPNTKVSWKTAVFGGAVAGFFWELFKKGFALYLGHFANYNKLYGALGGAVLLVTWIWYSCVLLLVGAILCKMYQEHTEEGGVLITARKRR